MENSKQQLVWIKNMQQKSHCQEIETLGNYNEFSFSRNNNFDGSFANNRKFTKPIAKEAAGTGKTGPKCALNGDRA